jgi:hypothetical protein
MEAGQIIKTTCHIPPNPIPGVEGNAYPIGSTILFINKLFISNTVKVNFQAHYCPEP